MHTSTVTRLSCDIRDLLIEQLMREIVELKDRVRELEEQNMANLELLGALRTQMEEVRLFTLK